MVKEAQVKLRSGRVVFRGPQDDAEEYITNHFPRVHVEPGVDYGDEGPQPDATLIPAESDPIAPAFVPDDKTGEQE